MADGPEQDNDVRASGGAGLASCRLALAAFLMPTENTRNARLEVRVSVVERRAAEKAARARKMPLSEWVRAALRGQAERDLGEAVPWVAGQ